MAAWLAARKVALGLILLVLVSGTAGVLLFGLGLGRPPADALLLAAPSPLTTPASPARSRSTPAAPTTTPVPRELKVYITGAVQHPGVYTADAATRVSDILAAAGGPAPDADLERINLAARVHDEEQIDVPHQGAAAPPRPTNSPAAVNSPVAGPAASPGRSGGKTLNGPVDINTADVAALQALPGIGPALAGRIVDYRTAHGPFARVDAIKDVSGIGPKIFARIQDLITVSP